MSLRTRLCHLERILGEVRGRGIRCSTCGAPVPSVPGTMMIGNEGVYELWGRVPCPECSGLGGRWAVAIDERSGKPVDPVKLVGIGITADEWFPLHGDRSFGQPWDRFLDLYRPDGESIGDAIDSEESLGAGDRPRGEVFRPPWPELPPRFFKKPARS